MHRPADGGWDGPAEQLRWMEALAAGTPSRQARLAALSRRYLRDRTGSWHVLRAREFRAYFIGCTISNLGTWLQNTAQLLLAYRLTHDVFDIALIVSAQFAGFLAIGPWAGNLAARIGSKPVLVGSQLFSAAVTGALAFAEIRGGLTVPDLIIGALLTGIALTFALPVQTTMLAALVPEHDTKAALAMNSVSYNAGRTLAPVLCLAVIASLGPAWAFGLNALTFLTFALIITFIYPGRAIVRQEPLRAAGIAAIAFKRPRIVLLLLMVAAVTLADDPVLVLGPSLAQQMGIPSYWPAYFLVALGIGTVVGALFPTRAATTRRAAVPLAVLAASVLAFAAGTGGWFTVAAAVGAGMAGLLTGSAAQVLLLRLAPRENVVQVMALWAVAWAGTKPIASLLDGALANQFGSQAAAAVLAFPALAIGMTEICLSKTQKDRLKARMSRWNGTASPQTAQPAV
jgi:MFS family permease